MYSLRECCDKPINGKDQQDIIHWQSDYPILSKKFVKTDGEKGVAVMRWGTRETSARLAELGDR